MQDLGIEFRREFVWNTWCSVQNEFYGKGTCNVTSCYECGRVLHKKAKPGDKKYWIEGHISPVGDPSQEEFVLPVSDVRIICVNCNTGKFRAYHSPIRAALNGNITSMAFNDLVNGRIL